MSTTVADQDALRPDDHSPWWFALVRLWTTVPILAIAAGVAYAGHVLVGGIALALVATGFLYSRWARAQRARVRERLKTEPGYREEYNRRSDRLSRFFGLYFAACGAVLVLAAIALVIAKLA